MPTSLPVPVAWSGQDLAFLYSCELFSGFRESTVYITFAHMERDVPHKPNNLTARKQPEACWRNKTHRGTYIRKTEHVNIPEHRFRGLRSVFVPASLAFDLRPASITNLPREGMEEPNQTLRL